MNLLQMQLTIISKQINKTNRSYKKIPLKHFALVFCLMLSACNSLEDCFSSSGNSVESTFAVEAFHTIKVYQRVKLIIKEAPTRSITIKTGENLIPNVKAIVQDSILQLIDNNTCNLSRSFNTTTIIVETPHLEEVYSYTDQDILSQDQLNFPLLRLYGLTKKGEVSGGDFHLNVNCQQLVVQSNSINHFHIQGFAENAIINFYYGLCTFHGQSLAINNLNCTHVSAHDITVQVQNNLEATLKSTGNLVLLNNPINLNYQTFFTGKVIFP